MWGKNLMICLGKQMKKSCRIKGDNEITDNSKRETNEYNMRGVCQLIVWIAFRICSPTGKYISNTEGKRLRYTE
jgi:hypothetical protein